MDPAIIQDEPDEPDASGIRPGDAVDLLFVVDNSTSMGDKQALFADAVPDLIDMLVHPPCLSGGNDDDPSNDTILPFDEDGSCPAETRKLFEPVTDIHIGVISSSLGSHGLAAGQDGMDLPCPDEWHENDRGYLVPLVRPEATDLLSNSYQGLGFLVWDPAQAHAPPGDADQATLVQKFQAQVRAVRETGCGFEAPLEAAYRFLVDPAPHLSFERVDCVAGAGDNSCVQKIGVDQEVLTERANFLRPDSHLVVTFLTDENDCSIKDSGQGYYPMRPLDQMLRGTAACQVSPDDPCCQSCGLTIGPECDQDPTTNGCEARHDAFELTPEVVVEAYNVRCFDQKRRFGIDYLYSVERYYEGFTQLDVTLADGTQAPNPLFPRVTDAAGMVMVDEEGNPMLRRRNNQVFVVGIVGTPWQDVTHDIADPSGKVLRADQLDWSLFLPSETSPDPRDPFNIEAMRVREGVHPETGDVLGGPGTTNQINGHDRAITSGDGLLDDVQYACTFLLAEPRDCAAPDASAQCDCAQTADADYAAGNPLCLAPGTTTYGTTQYYAKAYPGTRLMELVKFMGPQAVLGSICPKSLDRGRQDYGYRPPIRALLLELSGRAT